MADKPNKVPGITVATDTNTGGFARRTYVLKPNQAPATRTRLPETAQPKDLAKACNDLWVALEDAAKVMHSNPKAHGTYFKDIQFTNGQTTTLVHNMNRRCRYELTNVRDAAPNAFRKQSDEASTNSITITAGATFRADVHVYPEP